MKIKRKPVKGYLGFPVKVKVTQLYPTLCDPMDYTESTEFSSPGYWSGQPFPSPGDLPNPGIEPRFPALQVDSLPAELPISKTDLRAKKFTGDTEKHYIMIMISILQEDITILNVYVPNKRASNQLRQKPTRTTRRNT